VKRFAATALSAALLSAPLTAHAIRVWEEAPPGAVPVGGPAPTTPPTVGSVINSAISGPNANPDLHPADEPYVTPLAAGGPAGASRYAPGVAQRWLDIGVYTQPRFTYTTGYDADSMSNFSPPPGFTLRRTRIIVHAQLHPLLQLRMEANMADRFDLLDAYALIPVHRAFQIQLGQFRVPFSRQELVSGGRYQLPDTSLWSGGANGSGINFIPSFDIGAMVWGWVGPRDMFEYYVGMFNGEGRNQINNLDGFFLYAARVAFNPIGRIRQLQEGAVGVRRPGVSIALDGETQTRQIGFATVDGNRVPNREGVYTLGADVSFAGWGASFYGEIYYRYLHETDTTAAPSTESLGWILQAGYLLPIPHPWFRDRLEIVARLQDFDPSDCFTRAMGSDCGIRPIASAAPDVYRDFQHTTAITFGLNWYQLGHGAKLQLAYTINRENRDIAGMPPGSGVVDNDTFVAQLTGSF
jgi:hypothetical protein